MYANDLNFLEESGNLLNITILFIIQIWCCDILFSHADFKVISLQLKYVSINVVLYSSVLVREGPKGLWLRAFTRSLYGGKHLKKNLLKNNYGRVECIQSINFIGLGPRHPLVYARHWSDTVWSHAWQPGPASLESHSVDAWERSGAVRLDIIYKQI